MPNSPTEQTTPAPLSDQMAEAPARPPMTPPRVAPLAFRSATPDPTTPSSNTAGATGDGTGGYPDSPRTSETPPEQDEISSGSSRESSRANLKGAKFLREHIATAIDVATGIAHEFLARDELAKSVQLWIADEQDRDGISAPTASILARRGVMEGATSDVADVIQLGIALGGYAFKQLAKMRTINRVRRENLPGAGDGDLVDTAENL